MKQIRNNYLKFIFWFGTEWHIFRTYLSYVGLVGPQRIKEREKNDDVTSSSSCLSSRQRTCRCAAQGHTFFARASWIRYQVLMVDYNQNPFPEESKIFERELQQSRSWICFSQNSQTNRFDWHFQLFTGICHIWGCVGIFWENVFPLQFLKRRK